MLNPAIEDLILDYNIYSTIIEKFGTNRNQVFDTNYDVVLKHAEVEQAKRTKYDKTYKEVYRHLHNSGVMYDYMAQGCKYISYLIHKEVKNIPELHYNEETFKIFRKFVEDYHKYQRNTKNSCLPNIVYVDDDMYEKLDKLYRLYNKYTEVLTSSVTLVEKCLPYKAFIELYNDYIKYNKPTSLTLNNILTHLESKVSNTIKGIEGICTEYKYPLKKIELHKKPEENTQHRTTELAPLPSQALQDEVENQRGRTSTEATQLTLTSSLPSSPELGTITAESGIQPGVETDLHSGRGPGLVREQIRETEPQGYELHDYRRHGTHVLNETIGKSGYRTAEAPLEQLKLMGERSKYPQDGLEMEQGTMGKITGAITGVLREVEPGPILGVSGGMGALFLLFKVFIALKIYLYVNNTFM
ncbi:hypothetical protein PVBG_06031 [Plasmodium vivax Brazil I]|uniref:Uncharacterized protein n=1 Tax=Plasmodium vivax (strain Brazil I) TaxID=1033975 RepID=A0A0J9SJJ5_PLAV1|nr:hypothetical protein PVBG_06031 [Plasmodium vivax Brazil I]